MRLRQVALAAHDLDRVCDDLAEVLAPGTPFADPGIAVFGLRNAVFPVGDTFLEVVSPAQPNTAAGRFLERRGGDGGYMVIVQSSDLARDRRRVEDLGVRVVWETQLSDIATIHLHPHDVGGAILSLDVADPPASWRWAGPDWESRSRRDVTTALVGVEIRAADPVALAERWSRVLDRPTASDATAASAIPLDAGTLRFVAGNASEAPGISAIDLVAVDPTAVLAAAEHRGLAVGGDAFAIAGTCIRLSAA